MANIYLYFCWAVLLVSCAIGGVKAAGVDLDLKGVEKLVAHSRRGLESALVQLGGYSSKELIDKLRLFPQLLNGEGVKQTLSNLGYNPQTFPEMLVQMKEDFPEMSFPEITQTNLNTFLQKLAVSLREPKLTEEQTNFLDRLSAHSNSPDFMSPINDFAETNFPRLAWAWFEFFNRYPAFQFFNQYPDELRALFTNYYETMKIDSADRNLQGIRQDIASGIKNEVPEGSWETFKDILEKENPPTISIKVNSAKGKTVYFNNPYYTVTFYNFGFPVTFDNFGVPVPPMVDRRGAQLADIFGDRFHSDDDESDDFRAEQWQAQAQKFLEENSPQTIADKIEKLVRQHIQWKKTGN